MGKKVILTEAQFKEYMRSVSRKLNEQQDGGERDLETDEIEMLLHKIVDSDFNCYFKGGKSYWCAYLKEKGEILDAVCSSFPAICSNGLIRVSNDKYGYFYIDNLINAQI